MSHRKVQPHATSAYMKWLATEHARTLMGVRRPCLQLEGERSTTHISVPADESSIFFFFCLICHWPAVVMAPSNPRARSSL